MKKLPYTCVQLQEDTLEIPALPTYKSLNHILEVSDPLSGGEF